MKLKAHYYKTYQIKDGSFCYPKLFDLKETIITLPNNFITSLPLLTITYVWRNKNLYNRLFLYNKSSCSATFAIENYKVLVIIEAEIIDKRDENET
jgi:hypothetical protein